MKRNPSIMLIRHAEAVCNTAEGMVVGRASDSLLTPKGQDQAKKLGEYFRRNRYKFQAAYSSPAKRALETARLSLASQHNLDVRVDDRLHEMDQGLWAGMNRNDVYSPEVLNQIKRLGKDFKSPDGESMNDVGERMSDWAHDILKSGMVSVAAYTHVVAIACLLARIFDLSHDQVREFIKDVDKTSLTLLAYDGTWHLEYVGRLPR